MNEFGPDNWQSIVNGGADLRALEGATDDRGPSEYALNLMKEVRHINARERMQKALGGQGKKHCKA